MTLTVRHQGQLLSTDTDELIDDVVAVVWFDSEEKTGAWGGIVEPAMAAEGLRRAVTAGRRRYRLRLNDGREGVVDLSLSEFVADGVQPLTFAGRGTLGRGIGRVGA